MVKFWPCAMIATVSFWLTSAPVLADKTSERIAEPMFCNPIAEGEDPWVIRHDGAYYWCQTMGTRGVEVWKSETLCDLGVRHVAWNAPDDGPYAHEVWAPELHRIRGKWYIYVAVSDGNNANHRMIVLESSAAEPLEGFELKAELYTGDNPDLKSNPRWAIDATPFEHDGKLYVIWSGWEDERDIQYLYIAPLANPWTVSGPRVRICNNADYLWERVSENANERGLNEAPEILKHDGRTFLIYSCSASWQPLYKLGLLELRAGGDPLNSQDWQKHAQPVFQRSQTTFGAAHCSFISSPDTPASNDNNEHWLLYHAKADTEDGWRRAIFAQPFTFDAAGFPQFGEPDDWGAVRATPFGQWPQTINEVRDDFRHRLAGWAYDGDHQYPARRHGRVHLGYRYDAKATDEPLREQFISRRFHAANMRARAQVCVVAGAGSAGLVLRASACGEQPERGYYVGLSPAEDQVFVKALAGDKTVMIAARELKLEPDKSYALHVVMRGENITVAIDGKRVLTARDDRFKAGTVGMRVIGGHAWFDQFSARGEE